MRTSILGFFILLGPILNANAALVPAGKAVEYKQENTTLEGFLVNPKNKGVSPAVIVIHEWLGINSFTKKRAQMFADLGYVAFAADIYGKGIRPKSAEEASSLATKYKNDRSLLRARARAAYEYVAKLPNVDKSKIVVLGYCFGGTTALELARSGADLAATVSFHGGLSTPNAEDAKQIKGKVLVHHGADDPYVPMQEVISFQEEMRKAKVDWQMISYGNAVHSFTNFDLPMKPGAGAGYNAVADKRSWETTKLFLKESLR